MASRHSHAPTNASRLSMSCWSRFADPKDGEMMLIPQLRSFRACSGFHYKGPAPRNPQLILNLLAFVGAGLRRDAIASYVCYGSLWLSSNKSQFAFVVLSPLRYENLFFMSSCQKYTSSCPPCKYRTKSKKLLQNKNPL